MKKIKNYIFFVLFAFVISCSQNSKQDNLITNNGKVIVSNGKDIKDTISYTCVGCQENIKYEWLLNSICDRLTSDTRKLMKFPLSFIPIKIDITIIKQDSLIDFETNKTMDTTYYVIAKYYYNAKNAYGNELEGDVLTSIYIDAKGNTVDIEDKIKLDNLKFEGSSINRNLNLWDISDGSSISVIPTKNKQIIVSTSINCVREGAWLIIRLENKEEITLVSWNDFNCDGNSYFKWFNAKQINKLKESNVASVSLIDKESVACVVPKNKSDYFIQLLSLFNDGKKVSLDSYSKNNKRTSEKNNEEDEKSNNDKNKIYEEWLKTDKKITYDEYYKSKNK